MKKPMLISGIVILSLGIIVLILLPTGIKWWIHKNSPEMVGRQVELDKLRINYFNGNLRVEGFKIYEQDGLNEFIGFDALDVNIGLYSLLKKQIVISHLYLEGNRINIWQQGKLFNFSDLIDQFADTTSVNIDTISIEEEKASFLDEYSITVKNFRFSHGSLDYEDRDLNEKLGFSNIHFVLPEFMLGDSSSSALLELDFNDGGSLTTSIDLDMDKDIFELNINIDSMSLEPGNLFILRNEYINIQDLSGRFSQHVNIKGNPNDLLSATHSGNVEISDFSLIDEWGSEFLSFKELYFYFDTFNWGEKMILVDHLTVVEPVLRLEVREDGNTLGRLVDLPDSLASQLEDPAIAEENEQPKLAVEQMAEDASILAEYMVLLLQLDEYNYQVDSIVVSDGLFHMKDNTLTSSFEFELSDFDFKALGLGSGGISIAASSIVNRTGRTEFSVARLQQDSIAFDITYGLKNLDMEDFSPYMIYYTGSPIEEGKMDMYTVAAIRGNSLISENAIDLLDIEFGKKQGKGVYKLPVKFAVSLLRNPAGHIELDIPIEGSLEDPNFKIGKEIAQGILNVAFNVVASPVRFLANTFKKDPKELSEVDYEYLDPAIMTGDMKTLDDLRQILKAKSGINVQMIQCGDIQMAMTRYALFRSKTDFYRDHHDFSADSLLSALDSIQIASIPDDDSLFVAFINAKIQDRELNLDEKCIAYVGEEQIRQDMDSLFEERNEFVRGYFRNQSDMEESRINVYNAEFDTLSIDNKRPFFMINFVPPEE